MTKHSPPQCSPLSGFIWVIVENHSAHQKYDITPPYYVQGGAMLSAIKEALGTTVLEGTGRGGGGCISEGEVYHTDTGKVFIKRNSKEKAREMFDGEYASLKAIKDTNTVRAPTPHLVLDNPAGGAVLVMEYLDMHSLSSKAGQLGMHLA
ncbi:ketosamine-3-kinase-like, partial [Eriocheir sinensis]|uniref:ketosamine-3-kinase-like n=1 Tax=Eriocheir sinensis TaxID=95602 RepID=UPI0021C98108